MTDCSHCSGPSWSPTYFFFFILISNLVSTLGFVTVFHGPVSLYWLILPFSSICESSTIALRATFLTDPFAGFNGFLPDRVGLLCCDPYPSTILFGSAFPLRSPPSLKREPFLFFSFSFFQLYLCVFQLAPSASECLLAPRSSHNYINNVLSTTSFVSY